MKSLWISLFLPLSLFSLNVGNPYSPEILRKGIFLKRYYPVSARAGYEGNFVPEHRMKQVEEGNGRVDSFSFYGNSGSITFNVVERVDIYALLGEGKIEAKWRFTFDGITNRVVAKSDPDLFWALGTNALLLHWGKVSLGVGGKYMEGSSSVENLRINDEDILSSGLFSLHEWQVNVGVSYLSGILIPYIGILYDQVCSHLQSNSSDPISNSGLPSNHFENRSHVGVYLGCSVSSGTIFFMNVEARIIEEEAISISGDFRF